MPFARAADVDRAVQAAPRPPRQWGAASLTKRARCCSRFRELLDAHKDELAA